jgi:hypothetical protein
VWKCVSVSVLNRIPYNIEGMRIRLNGLSFSFLSFLLIVALATGGQVSAQSNPPSGSSAASPSSSTSTSSTKKSTKAAAAAGFRLDPGAVKNGVYRNSGFVFACKIPAGWVLRTDEMNSRQDNAREDDPGNTGAKGSGHVLFATFSRPPEARGADVNSSIVIAAESVSEYPGLKEAAQYFGPVTEIAQARGLEVANEPYEFAIGTKNLVRGDFQENVGTRIMMQSTLVMLARGYVVSFTFIAGTEDEMEESIGGLSFGAGKTGAH